MTTMALLYLDLKDAFQTEWCCLCYEMARATLKYMRYFVREGKADGQVWAGLLRSRGLCHRHALVMLRAEVSEYGDGLSTGTLYDWLLDDLLRTIQKEDPGAGQAAWRNIFRRDGEPIPAAQRLAERLTPSGPCQACVHLDEYEASAAWGFQRFVSPSRGEAEFRDGFEAAAPLCLPHFRAVLREAEDGGTLDYLVQAQARKLHDLSRELKEYLRKHNYQYSHEPMGREKDSWRRTLRAFVGQMPDEATGLRGRVVRGRAGDGASPAGGGPPRDGGEGHGPAERERP